MGTLTHGVVAVAQVLMGILRKVATRVVRKSLKSLVRKMLVKFRQTRNTFFSIPRDFEPPVTFQVELNGVPCDMEWDTGDPRSIMPHGTFKDLFRDRVRLKKTSVNLRGYGGK